MDRKETEIKLNKAYLTGYEDGSIKSESNITRAEVATIIEYQKEHTKKQKKIWTDNIKGTWYYEDTRSKQRTIKQYPLST